MHPRITLRVGFYLGRCYFMCISQLPFPKLGTFLVFYKPTGDRVGREVSSTGYSIPDRSFTDSFRGISISFHRFGTNHIVHELRADTLSNQLHHTLPTSPELIIRIHGCNSLAPPTPRQNPRQRHMSSRHLQPTCTQCQVKIDPRHPEAGL